MRTTAAASAAASGASELDRKDDDKFVPSTVEGDSDNRKKLLEKKLLEMMQKYNDYVVWLKANILHPMRKEIERHGGEKFNENRDSDLFLDQNLQPKTNVVDIKADRYSDLSLAAQAKILILDNLIADVRGLVVEYHNQVVKYHNQVVKYHNQVVTEQHGASSGQAILSIEGLHSNVHARIKRVVDGKSEKNLSMSKNPLADVFRFLAGLLLSVPTFGLAWFSNGYKNLFWNTASQVKVDEIYNSSLTREPSTNKL